MPCPRFEPLRIAADPQHPNARLPLLDEYDGQCHATAKPFDVPAALRFRHCNHGNSAGVCPHVPAGETRTALRYMVAASDDATLTVLCIEEQNYAPAAWSKVRYRIDAAELQPPIENSCLRAQVLAFCQSYLRRLSPQKGRIG